MYKDKIGKFEFVFEEATTRIIVYRSGDESPVRYINVSEDLSEKDFHYEIMDFASKMGG
tara:strand:+ start:305 stop:481 length:177 start_codon:yes stop_codon:yes gene_type:complete